MGTEICDKRSLRTSGFSMNFSKMAECWSKRLGPLRPPQRFDVSYDVTEITWSRGGYVLVVEHDVGQPDVLGRHVDLGHSAVLIRLPA